ncbi:hypothetical protein ACFSTC_30375 [Nonomuraea ferruginea]
MASVLAFRVPPGRSAVARPASHRLFAAVLVLAAALRVLVMLGYDTAMVYWYDSFTYLDTAVRMRPNGAFHPAGYSAFLWLLRPFHSVELVAGVQHAMGLGVAVLMYALLRSRGLPGWGATLATLPVLFDPSFVRLEHAILSDLQAIFLVMAALLVLGRREEVTARAAAGADLLLALAGLTRTAAVPLIGLAALWLLLRRGSAPAGGRPAGGQRAAAARLRRMVRTPPRPVRAQRLRRRGVMGPHDDVRRLLGHPAAARRGATLPERHRDGRRLRVRVGARRLAQPAARRPVRVQRPGQVLRPARHRRPALGLPAADRRGHRARLHLGAGAAPRPDDADLHVPVRGLDRARQRAGARGPRRLRPGHQGDAVGGAVGIGAGRLPVPVVPARDPLRGAAAGRGRRVRRAAAAALLPWAFAAFLLVAPVAALDFDHRYVLPAIPPACVAAALAVHGIPRPRYRAAGDERTTVNM